MADPNAKKLTEMTADELRVRVIELSVELRDTREACNDIVALAAGWDEDGATGPKEPYSWESIARMAMDYAHYAITKKTPR